MTAGKRAGTPKTTPDKLRAPSWKVFCEEVFLLTEDDTWILSNGTYCELHEKPGVHPFKAQSLGGTYLVVWTRSVEQVFVVADLNGCDKASYPLHLNYRMAAPRGAVWEDVANRDAGNYGGLRSWQHGRN